jgi:hypothetical protein
MDFTKASFRFFFGVAMMCMLLCLGNVFLTANKAIKSQNQYLLDSPPPPY